MLYSIHWITTALLLLACSVRDGNTGASGQPRFTAGPGTDFGKYWYAGKAELSRYRLEQAHYGAVYPGEAVLVFVTEDFLTDKQVKLETEKTDKSTSVLKLNFIRRFVTGVYDYSLFTSVFTPIQTDKFPQTLKVTTSVQDWCGQTYSQLNFRNNQYQIASYSYFQQEADEQYTAGNALLEDEIWTRIRINPKSLPTGKVTILPGTGTARLRHQRLQPEAAQAALTPYLQQEFAATDQGAALQSYTLTYADGKRSLRIVFEKAFPHGIVGWEETYESKGKTLTTRARRTNTILSDYWTKNTPGDTTLRQELGIQREWGEKE